jgi:hypothetical protein
VILGTERDGAHRGQREPADGYAMRRAENHDTTNDRVRPGKPRISSRGNRTGVDIARVRNDERLRSGALARRGGPDQALRTLAARSWASR